VYAATVKLCPTCKKAARIYNAGPDDVIATTDVIDLPLATQGNQNKGKCSGTCDDARFPFGVI
jgi:hypothetical protein